MVHLVRTSWTGTSGGLGVTQWAVTQGDGSIGVMSSGDAQDAVNAARTFWDAVKAYFPNEVTFTVSPVVDYYIASTGVLAGSVTAITPPVAVVGSSTLSYGMASGLKLNWHTGMVRNGRRVRGSTFLVPTTNNAYSPTGTADATARTTIATAAGAYMTSLGATGLKAQVWSRPFEGSETVPARSGDVADVSAVEVSEKTAILRGRRD